MTLRNGAKNKLSLWKDVMLFIVFVDLQFVHIFFCFVLVYRWTTNMVFLWRWTRADINEAKWHKSNVFLPIWPSRVTTNKNQLHKIRLFSLGSGYFRGFFQLPEVFCKKDVLKNFTKFIWKYLCQNLFFNKVVGLGLQLY